MAACSDFFKKWKREYNFCGLGEHSAKQVNKFIDFVEDLSKESGIPEDVIYSNVTRGAVSGVMKFEKGSNIRRSVSKIITDTLKSKRAVTKNLINASVGLPIEEQRIKAIVPKRIALNAVDVSNVELTHNSNHNIKNSIKLIKRALTPGQLAILNRVSEKFSLDDEYSAISLIITWAGERV